MIKPTEEELEKLRFEEKLSPNKIAKKLNCSSDNVKEWIIAINEGFYDLIGVEEYEIF